MKGCCFIKFRDDAIFPLFFLSISFLPLFRKCYCAGFHSGAFIHCAALWLEKKPKEIDLLLGTEDGLKELRGCFFFSFKAVLRE